MPKREETFVIASNNAHKAQEIRRILAPLGIRICLPAELGKSFAAEETGTTFAENARIKALAACAATGLPAVADDSGLAVDALGGAPGVYSARYAGEGARDAARIAKLLAALGGVPEATRAARFVCSVCGVFPDGESVAAEESCEGSVAFAPQGEDGFGYDPVFIEKSTGKTFAQLTAEEKDRLSHRGKALRLFAVRLRAARGL